MLAVKGKSEIFDWKRSFGGGVSINIYIALCPYMT